MWHNPDWDITLPASPLARWTRLIRPPDFVWILLFGALIATAEYQDVSEISMLAALGLVQVLEPKIRALATTGGRVFWVVLKLALAYVLIGYTGAINSRYWLVLLLPVVSAASNLGVVGTQLFILAAIGAYLSFFLYVDWTRFMSAGLAHELRNPLGTVKASAEMLSRSLSAENEMARELAGFISSEVDRVNSLITRFLQFARPLELRLEAADLTHMLDRAIAAAEREVPGIAIYRNYTPEIPPFPFDAELMERVFYNLVVNAAQATAPGGAVTVKTRAADSTAEIAVIDRGSGIEAAQMETIFNPFFTTKPQGVGLGLAIVSKIVDRHGGKITVESEAGKGSVFRVQLPMEPARRPEPPESTA